MKKLLITINVLECMFEDYWRYSTKNNQLDITNCKEVYHDVDYPYLQAL